MWPSGVSRKKIESQPKVSDAGLSAPVIGTSRISIADSPESLVNILTRRMPVYRGSGPSRSRRSVGGLPAHLARVGKGLPPSLGTTSRNHFATLESKPSLSEEAGWSRICIHAGRTMKSRGTRRGIATFTLEGYQDVHTLRQRIPAEPYSLATRAPRFPKDDGRRRGRRRPGSVRCAPRH